MQSTIELAEKLPKAELHLHIEGSLEPEMMFALAERNGVTLPYADVEAVRQAYQFNNLQEFLDLYYAGMSVLLKEQDFYDLTWAYLEHCHQDNVIHTEIFFDPQAHLERGVDFETQFNGIYRALCDGRDKLGITFRLILSFLRHLSEDSAFETLELATPYLDRIDGVGLDSSEMGHPPEKFERVFRKCRELGLRITAHAGEEGPPDYVWQAIRQLEIQRIDHGNRALEDEALTQLIAEKGLTLTVCPLSNLRLCVVDDLADHPLPTMFEKGLHVTLNSDDPAYFGGYVNANFRAMIEQAGLTRDQVITLARNSIEGSWLDDADKRAALTRIDSVCAEA
ncbi:adenosine deaminase [Marinobacter sp. JSM 1782161]|uniref:adenosine deaminase n=1 Tax=Marinobacter sp. JSM 1782161 TaxID=2685906 RepID=UPI0014039990|nr:adenosine deaminase [Marinobacter sp. JSM 1782161]